MPYAHLIAATVMTLGVWQGHSSIVSFLLRDAMLVRYMPSSCVCVSFTHRYCMKMAKHRIMQIVPHDSLGTLVLS